MLQKIIIKGKCSATGTVKGYGGTEIHGWFFKMLEEINPELSARIHGMDEKPFSIGPVYGGKKEKGKTVFEEGEEYSFTFASLNEEIFKVVSNMAFTLVGNKIYLGTAGLNITEVRPIFGSKGLSFYDILEKHSLVNREITLQFSSSTSFRQQGTQEIFPQPDLVFGSLLRKWNAFSPVSLPGELGNSPILVKKYNLKTELVDFGKYKVIGCIGNSTYQLDKSLPNFQVNMLNSLAFFAGIAGIGYKTSMGLGDARYLYDDRR
ncbi:MAG: CRISPR-associated endoribonuclease Cas6 [Bacillota bacterium]